MSASIVPIAEDHIEGYHTVMGAVARERRYIAFLDAPPIESTREFVIATIAARNPQFVALIDGKVIGWCDVTPKPREVMNHSGVLGMGLVDAHRGQGIGAQLLKTTLDAAKAMGLVRVELHVRVDNKPAIRLYEKFGFSIEGRMQRYMKVDNEYFDGLAMAVLF